MKRNRPTSRGVAIRLLAAVLLMLAGPTAHASQTEVGTEGPFKLEYKLQEGDVLEYRVQMSSGSQEELEKIEGLETHVVTSVDEDGTLSMLFLPSGTKLYDLHRSKTLTEFASSEPGESRVRSPFFDSGIEGWSIASGSPVPSNPFFHLFATKMSRNGWIAEGIQDDFLERHTIPYSIGE